MCKIVTEEFSKLNPALNSIMRGGSPSVSGAVIRRIVKLYEAVKPGTEVEVVVTKEGMTYLQVNDKEEGMLVTEHFNHVFDFGAGDSDGKVALLDLIDAIMGNVNDEERQQFERAKERVKHSQAFCLSLKFQKT